MGKQTDFKARQSAGTEHQWVMLCAGMNATATAESGALLPSNIHRLGKSIYQDRMLQTTTRRRGGKEPHFSYPWARPHHTKHFELTARPRNPLSSSGSPEPTDANVMCETGSLRSTQLDFPQLVGLIREPPHVPTVPSA
jgi:hypothetical protein